MKKASTYIQWPNREERQQMCREVANDTPNCIGFIDGSHIPLAQAPLVDKESYFTRKSRYAMHLQVVVDHCKKIIFLDTGLPGSCHDARVLSKSKLALNPADYFSEGEYIYGDSAYKETNWLITPFKINATFSTAQSRNKFNRFMAERRVKIENVSSNKFFKLNYSLLNPY